MASFSATELPTTKIYVREKNGSFLYEGPIVPAADENGDIPATGYSLNNANFPIPKNLKFPPIFDPTGRICCIRENQNLLLCSATDGSTILELPVTDAQKVDFSPRGSYLTTWSIPVINANKEAAVGNLKIWNATTGTLITSYFQKTYKTDLIQWTSDEKYCFRQVTNEIHIYKDDKLSATDSIERLRYPGFSQYKIASNDSNSTLIHIAVFTPEGGGKPGKVTLFTCNISPTITIEGPRNSRTIFGANEALLLWNKSATTLLIHSQSDVDATGASYYGSTGLYIMSSVSDLSAKVEQTKDGPVHAVQWSPTGDRFVVAAGNMPCQCTMHNDQCVPVYQFGAAHRNVISFAPHGRFLCLAGFGNLAGEMDFYDLLRLKKLGSNSSHCAISYCWSPDSRYFLTATLAPRMNVDNGFKLFKYNGVGPIFHQPIERAFEVAWQPILSDVDIFPNRGPTPPRRNADGTIAKPPVTNITTAAAITKPTTAYRPPGSTGSLSAMMKKENITIAAPVGKVKAETTTTNSSGGKFVPSSQKRVIPGMAPVVVQPAVVKQQQNKPKSQPQQQQPATKKDTVSTNNPQPTLAVAAAPPSTSSTPSDNPTLIETVESKEKRIKAISKKLKQIQEIRGKLIAGQSMEPEQLKKLDMEAALKAELESLN